MKPRFGLYVGYLQEDDAELRDVIRQALSVGECELIDEFVETDFKRFPALTEACAVAKENKAIIITPTMRNIEFKLAPLRILYESRVKIIVCDDKWWQSSNQSIKNLTRMRDQAENYIEEHSKKVKRGLKKAKAAGKKLGAPKNSENLKLAYKANSAKAEKFRREIMPIINNIRAKGAKTNQEIADALSDLNVKTAMGKSKWFESTVRNVIKKMED